MRSTRGITDSLSDHKLPRGRHGIPREQVAESQRWRLLGAAAEVLAERGYVRARVEDIATRAGVSRGTLYEQFDSLGACLLAAYEMAADCVCDLAVGACAGEGSWEERLRTALDEILLFLAEEPALAHLLGAEAALSVPAIGAARERLLDRLAAMGAERYSLEGAAAFASERVAVGEADRLPALAGQLAELIRPAAGSRRQRRGGPST
ncbi:MAG TPA: helix-turn-helix domain-containing protein [Solirubrobacterales bacterium]|nr:helix-turn-helix domain-containing protein [Solirubrobacterales bacterium]